LNYQPLVSLLTYGTAVEFSFWFS